MNASSPPGAVGHPLPQPIAHARDLFEAAQFYACHEFLEDHLWRPFPPGEVKTFYQGWIQLAVGRLHHQRGNATGTRNLLSAALDKLTPWQARPPFAAWLPLEQWLAEARQILAETPPASAGE